MTDTAERLRDCAALEIPAAIRDEDFTRHDGEAWAALMREGANEIDHLTARLARRRKLTRVCWGSDSPRAGGAATRGQRPTNQGDLEC